MAAHGRAALAFVTTLACAASASAASEFAYVDDPRAALAEGAIVVDTRPLAACRERSLANARCLPADDALGPHRSLPAWRDLHWLLATVGLTGRESVLVVGDDLLRRDFVAGVLYAAGQARVLVLAKPVARALADGQAAGPGRERAFARATVYEAPMRDDRIVLARELLAGGGTLVDGRSGDEYWGVRVRAARGGHVSGAISLPMAELRGRRPHEVALPAGQPIAYAHDPLEGFAYFTLLRAGFGVDARVYPNGWAEWAADASRPAAAVTHPERAAAPLAGERTAGASPMGPGAWLAVLAAGLAAAFFAGLALGRRRSG